MKILKKILIGLAVFIALLLLIAVFIPTTYTVSVSTTIHKPQQEVYDYVKQIKNQENYSIWVMQDTNVVMTYTGTDGTVGFIANWNSKDDNVGEGEQEITKVDGERVDVDLRFKRPFEGQSKAATIVKAVSANETQVTSEFYGHNPYPTNLMCFVGKMFIKDAQTQNMANLKAILEK
ncbi:SRPBCC family protein [Cytophaga hutchinsonii]|uniref:Polyketide cyclase n=1 Tax=Cytophaga hutchinsonii (strain ATCC 33406 / DSM 1761 / CIP 103989 / NBRC 15051 / NCIMB 9469 / D465) TaxID=269798 RepID=A0A6N4SXM0_CYTH3|nr:SRPBCC family protein [Cytophaga hutchinsonii]ABG61022.1 conserved hypothetical protein [Cytophaga hutchinsonii ATCC 33406]SFX44544.1 Polyketide cyclase / dehydrase and lipid transport [Cytophaga hutchinsonii ATCC 33406]